MIVHAIKKSILVKREKAAVAGAFTGDHNVIFQEEEEGQAAGDIKGVRNRVKAGIMHFKYVILDSKI